MDKIKHLQEIILSIAKDIDELCRKNDIEYYLLGGSAIGAIRHQGFIPWDDDLDIIMTSENYDKFIKICREKLDKDKYYLQEGLVNWPLNFSKIRLKGTILIEKGGRLIDDECQGIYVDVFKMDNVSDNTIIARWQYFCGKYYLCYSLFVRKYYSVSIMKKIMMLLSFPMKLKCVRNYILEQTIKSNNSKTKRLGFYYGRTRWKSAIIDKELFGKPRYVKFADTFLPVPDKYHEYLTQVFGDYMKLPPEEQRVGLHLLDVDFGKY